MQARQTSQLALIALVGSLGCASTSGPRPRAESVPPRAPDSVRVLVLAPRWLTEAGDTVDAEILHEALTPRVALVRADVPPGEPCAADPACVRALGRDVGASHVLVTELAGLGRTTVVRIRLIEARPSGGDVARQRVIEVTTRERVERAMAEMATELVAPLAPTPEARRAWYERGYVYALGAAVIAGAIGTGIGVHRHRAGVPDVVITPP